MKKIFLFFTFIMIISESFSQQNNPAPALTKQDYLAKSKNQKTGAWVLLSGGFVMSAIGAGIGIDDAVDETSGALVTLITLGTVEPVSDKDNTAVANVLFFTGLVGMLGSIPLFKASKRNYRNGMSLSFSNQKIPSFQKSSFAYHAIPSLKLKINL